MKKLDIVTQVVQKLGLRGSILARYARESIVINIEEISAFVQQQRQYKEGDRTLLLTPCETVYPVSDLRHFFEATIIDLLSKFI